MIVEDMTKPGLFQDDVIAKTDRYRSMVYSVPMGLIEHVKSLCQPGSTVFMFSGSWNLTLDATYLELKFFQDCDLRWHPKTLFVEPQQQDLFFYTLNKLQPTNLIILHSDYWCGHRPFDDIIEDIARLKSFASQVICTMPIKHSNFNKLTTSVADLCRIHEGVSVFQDCFVMIK
jgi:hypothetical protein